MYRVKLLFIIGGEDEIRTRGSDCSLRRFSKPVVSATHPSLLTEGDVYVLSHTFRICSAKVDNFSCTAKFFDGFFIDFT